MSDDESRTGAILPREQGAAPLEVVIGVMAFLAALALGASLVADRAAQGWRAGLSGRVTVQILPPIDSTAPQNLDTETNAALAILNATPGIVHVSAVSQDEAMSLVRPWLGADALVADLPLPRLIDATLTPGQRIDLIGLESRLKAAAPDSTLDDHSHWIARLKGMADAIVWSGYAILMLIAIATAAAVTFATRAGLQAHHEIVALLHQMGAHSDFISRAFERHYFRSALIASAIGAGVAAVVFLAAGGLEMAGVEAVPFLPPIALRPVEALWLIAVPVVVSAIAWATARASVLSALRKIY
jgi:cell division transport system permease protein